MLTNLLLNQTAAAEPLYVEDVFSTYLYKGNSGSQLAITNGIDLLNKGGLIWTKSRNSVSNNFLSDSVSGYKYLLSNSTAAFGSSGQFSGSSDGYTILTGNSAVNQTDNYVSWTFRKAAKFFDVVTWTGTGSARTIAHNLGVAPGMIIVKQTDSADNWFVYHRSLGNSDILKLNLASATQTGQPDWNTTSPTSTAFSLGSSSNVNASGGSYVAYLFAHDTAADGIVQCGSFTTDASGNATVNLGWEPQYLLVKRVDSATGGQWDILDIQRGYTNGEDYLLYANTTDGDTNGGRGEPTATGFSWNYLANATHVYLAIRRGPMRTPTDATKVFQPVVYTGTNVDNRLVNTTIAPDMVMVRQRSDTVLGGMIVGDRLRGNPYLRTGGTNAEVSDADSFMTPTASYGNSFSAMNGFGVGNDATSKLNINTTSNNHIALAFKRAPSFFDIVAYTGTGSNTTISHNIGVVPELIFIKQRASTTSWAVYSKDIANTEYLVVNSNAGKASGTTYWNSTTPTTSVFSIGTSTSVNASAGTYVAYLFASCPGVSKVGSYTGNGTSQNIDCGFVAGARFVLIKRTDNTGDWYVWDTARGIVTASDPYLLLSSSAAEVTNTDYVDTYSAGFELSSTAPATLNEAPGITWVAQTSGFGTTGISDVTYGNGLYVAVGVSGKITTSTNAISWTSATGALAVNLLDIAYGNGIFVAVGVSGGMQTSPDGITWTSRTSGFGSLIIKSVVYGSGIYVAVGQSGKLTTSTDGITWTSQTSSFGTTTINKVTFSNGLFVAVGDSGTLATSTDGITWTQRTSGFGTENINSVTYGNGLYVAGGNAGTIRTSTDGVTWTSRTSGFGTTFISDVGYGNGVFVAVGNSGTMTTSTDGITWTSRTSGFGTTNISGIGYGNSIFVAVGASGTMTTNNPSYLYLAIA